MIPHTPVCLQAHPEGLLILVPASMIIPVILTFGHERPPSSPCGDVQDGTSKFPQVTFIIHSSKFLQARYEGMLKVIPASMLIAGIPGFRQIMLTSLGRHSSRRAHSTSSW